MANEASASIRDELLSMLAHQPRYIMTGMIKIKNPATPSIIKRSPNSSACLGQLDKLPLELLHLIFSMLDLKALSSITRTCLRGLAVVESLPEFRDLMRHAPIVMTALGSTQLIRYHSAHALHTALISSECVSCKGFGPFLFLPTCERCCYGCLWRNQSLWVVPVTHAQIAFDLSSGSLKTLPTMRNLPGDYFVANSITRKRRTRLVSIKAAKELAFSEGKDMESLGRVLDRISKEGLSRDRHDFLRWMQNAPLDPPGQDLTLRPAQANTLIDNCSGMASIPFASLRPGNRVENGLWCKGCEKTLGDWFPGKLNVDTSRFDSVGVPVRRGLYLVSEVGRSEADFFEHIAECPGAKEIVPDLVERLNRMHNA